ncbi:phospholipase A [Luteimonas sp. BDR2-5]|uniref:phospholipase A n=1 Tax=Proluteimonas luteida TaxID=2878685 RepID=UPI001E5D4604|nr:phospholipase A [Luteimonas sp. BDR2-5]MCD9028615.1 phospholipase A [Luteimonas sp. BDR2-5]
MTLRHSSLFLALAALAPVAAAQPAPAPASIDACVSLEQDAQRLACFDAATGRRAATPAAADSAAAQAREVRDGDADPSTLQAPAQRRADGDNLFAYDMVDDAIANTGKGSLLDSRWELAKDSKLGLFNMRAYKPVYLFPAFWTSSVNRTPSSPNPDNVVTTPQQLDSLETKFQLSFKTKAWEDLFGNNGDIWMGYTQSSRWQTYNSEQSRPFRETNYEPEVLLVFRNGYSIAGWHGRMAAIGINHQSNGRGDPLSRSWNRVMFNVGLDRDDWALMIRPWVRISDGSDDDNPDIEDYIGRGDVTLTHVRDGHEFSLMARHSLRGGDRSHGALQFDWGFPIHRAFRGHLQVFSGYGESLIDYNHRATYVGLGISLLEWF